MIITKLIREFMAVGLSQADAIELREKMRNTSSVTVNEVLEFFNEKIGGYGIESIRDSDWSAFYCDTGLLYVNRGESYATTLLYDTREDGFYLRSWVDHCESTPKRGWK